MTAGIWASRSEAMTPLLPMARSQRRPHCPVNPRPGARRRERGHALPHQRPDDPGQHVAAAGRRQRRRRNGHHGQPPFRRRHDRVGTLEQNDAAPGAGPCRVPTPSAAAAPPPPSCRTDAPSRPGAASDTQPAGSRCGHPSICASVFNPSASIERGRQRRPDQVGHKRLRRPGVAQARRPTPGHRSQPTPPPQAAAPDAATAPAARGNTTKVGSNNLAATRTPRRTGLGRPSPARRPRAPPPHMPAPARPETARCRRRPAPCRRSPCGWHAAAGAATPPPGPHRARTSADSPMPTQCWWNADIGHRQFAHDSPRRETGTAPAWRRQR